MEHPNPGKMHDYVMQAVKGAILARYIGTVPSIIVSWAGALTAIVVLVNQTVDLLIKLHVLK